MIENPVHVNNLRIDLCLMQSGPVLRLIKCV